MIREEILKLDELYLLVSSVQTIIGSDPNFLNCINIDLEKVVEIV